MSNCRTPASFPVSWDARNETIVAGRCIRALDLTIKVLEDLGICGILPVALVFPNDLVGSSDMPFVVFGAGVGD
jgi:hypothetical protein